MRGRSLGAVNWRFALQPKWLVRHIAVVALVVTMLLLGLWQLRRLDDKRSFKALVETRQVQPIEDVRDIIPSDAPVGSPALERVLYRRVTAVGEFADADTVVVENRTLNGASGAWVLTPLHVRDGAAVVVNRGFIGFDRDGNVIPPDPPTGTVAVEGLVLPSQQRGRFGPQDPDSGRLEVLARVDVERLGSQVAYPVYSAYLQLVSSDPAQPRPSGSEAVLVPLGPPRPDEGPHLAYAIQWFIFTTIAAVGYLVLLRRVASEQAMRA